MTRMRKQVLTSFLLAGMALSQIPAQASVRQYGATLENSEWRVSEYSPLQCTLEHAVPRFGEVRFVSEANRSLNMRLQLDMLRLPDTYDIARIKSVAPHWRPGVASHELGSMEMYRQFNSELDKEMAWTILTELEKGMKPTFFYQDWHNERDHIQVSLSAVNFHTRYDDFLQCVANLLPYSFEDISFTILNYQQDSDELTNASKRKLLQIGNYLRHDSDIQLVLVDAHTDSFGSFEENQQLAEQRAETVKAFLLEHGVSSEQIAMSAHGEMRQATGNLNELDRTRNRRVVVQMKRPFNPHLLSSHAD